MRSTQSVTGSWRRHGNNGRFVASKPLDAPFTPVGRDSAGDGFIRSHVAAGAESQRFADHTPATRKPSELGHTARAAKSVLVSVARYTAPNRLRLVWR